MTTTPNTPEEKLLAAIEKEIAAEQKRNNKLYSSESEVDSLRHYSDGRLHGLRFAANVLKQRQPHCSRGAIIGEAIGAQP